MGPNASGMGMMQNGGWSHMAGGHGMLHPDLESFLSASFIVHLPMVHTACVSLFQLCACPSTSADGRSFLEQQLSREVEL